MTRLRFRMSRGFTMVEMMVSTVTFLILMGLAFQTLLAANAVRQAAVARVDIYQNARSTLDVMTREIRNATLRDSDVSFSQQEIQGRNLSRVQNPRGRLIINDWPPYNPDIEGRDPRVYRGNEIDDDKDGRTDEEAYDGVDNDGDGEPNSPVSRYVPLQGRPMADGLDNNNNGRVDEGIDEDIYYPRDMINFLALIDAGAGADLVEVGYAIDVRTGRDLLRRTAFNNITQLRINATNQVDGIYPVALQYALGQQIPDPIFGIAAPWFDPETPRRGIDSEDGSIGLSIDGPAILQDQVDQVVEPMALHIVGFDVRAYYYNYLIAEARNNPTSILGSRFREARDYNPYSFPALSWDSSIENSLVGSIGSDLFPSGFLPNGYDDMAVIQGSARAQAFEDQPFGPQRAFDALAAQTDGLPRLLEITLFVEDQNRFRDEPIRISTRVFLPFETGDE